jgi:hypothetical protein
MLLPSSARAARKFKELFFGRCSFITISYSGLRVHPRSFWFCEVFDDLYERLRQILRVGIRTAFRLCGVVFFNVRTTLFILPFVSSYLIILCGFILSFVQILHFP